MGDLARLKDHVNHQLDLRAPFAFLPFNQITQARLDDPLVSGMDGPTTEEGPESKRGDQTPYAKIHDPVQVDPGHDWQVYGKHKHGSLYRISEDLLGASIGTTSNSGDGRLGRTNPNPFQDKEKAGEPTNRPASLGTEGGGPGQTQAITNNIHFIQEERACGQETMSDPQRSLVQGARAEPVARKLGALNSGGHNQFR